MAVVKINAIEIPPGAGTELERRFAARRSAMVGVPGFLGFELLRPVAGESRYFVYTRWETEKAYRAWAAGPAREAHGGGRDGGGQRPVASGATLLEFEVVPLTG
ncbi:antibiotic biosynthesis monooxygenase family protein [Plantactinospora siamensis]|uniref:Antibiotic biosynthesis monooxygenase family protein n=1 Tax=Plantactinospora siamensis TaxID=555372 RepID=A0ABV6P2X3_9ACTN